MTTFNCSCHADDAAEILDEKIHCAVKEHKCCECGGIIQPGDHYEKAECMQNGRRRYYKTCLPCRRVRQNYCPDGWIYGRLFKQIMDCLGFDYRKSELMNELTRE